jgi:predicted PurR-regulated permease PerM
VTARNEFISAGTLFKVFVAAAAVLLSAYLLWKLRSLIVPVTVSGLMAYICRPLIAHLEHYRIPRGPAMGLLLVVFVLVVLFVAGRISVVEPSEITVIELKVQALYKFNKGYNRLMGLDSSLTKGNRVYRLSHEELDPIIKRVNRFLALTREEESLFLAPRSHGHDAEKGPDRLLDYHRANLKTLKLRGVAALPEAGSVRAAIPAPTQAPGPAFKPPLAMVGHILSAWFIAPVVFLFLLRDTGEIKRGLLSMVPNCLFEPALTVLADLDRALGDYVRGIFLECVALGFSAMFLLAIVGVSIRWAIAIGMFTAATNVIPYLGSAAALVGGLAYALLAEEIHPILPMVNTENFAFWVIAAVGVAELLKNILYEPFVLGGSVKLHPLVVVIGIVAGGILFDFVGLLLAIPVITVFKVFISSTARQLKAYGLM